MDMEHVASEFFQAHPQLETLDLSVVDINGSLRGKRLPASAFAAAVRDGILLPQSVFASEIRGETVAGTGIGIDSGDQDRLCRLAPDTLRIVPSTNGRRAECLMDMEEDDGRPFAQSGRQVLKNVVARFHARGLRPTVAIELEFYLIEKELDRYGMPRLLDDAGQAGTQGLSLDDLDKAGAFIERVREYAVLQSVPASAASAEYAPGQFEINLRHSRSPVNACDDAVYLKRIIRRAACSEGMLATFMAKPFEGSAGSGSHLHVSLLDENGSNCFANGDHELQYAIAGLQATMPAAMLLFAPHANSYRRYRKNSYVPMAPSWGYNNRTVALRIPTGRAEDTRIEHRTPGADCNPYLAMAAVLAGILHGLTERRPPTAPINGDAAEQVEPGLPTDWLTAIRKFEASDWGAEYFGPDFCKLLSRIKHAECAEFNRRIPTLDIQWYLHST
ncbi:MAG: glutamine synthetase family protein [Woeseiaceae bacterium]